MTMPCEECLKKRQKLKVRQHRKKHWPHFNVAVSYPHKWSRECRQCKCRQVKWYKPPKDPERHRPIAMVDRTHDIPENNDDKLGADARRIILGVLGLDSKQIGDAKCLRSATKSEGLLRDLETPEDRAVQSLIVKWSQVKTIDINEKVDGEFIKRMGKSLYSRILVVGDSENAERRWTHCSLWNGNKIFGFLHVKSLIGLNVDGKRKEEDSLLVKDLPLSPVHIVRDDMNVYTLLNMFQLGMSRIAVVVPASRNAKFDWSVDFVRAVTLAKLPAEDSLPQRHRLVGVECPKPVGIVTFSDIVDAILQGTKSR